MRKISLLLILLALILCGCKDTVAKENESSVVQDEPVTHIEYIYEEPEKSSYSYESNNKTYTHDSYDDGYNDIYEEDDYDWDRYEEDDDYASGVDDAIEEYYDEFGEYWE